MELKARWRPDFGAFRAQLHITDNFTLIEEYYHPARPHQGLNDDTPVPSATPEPAADVSRLVSIPVVGDLHHRYIRVAA